MFVVGCDNIDIKFTICEAPLKDQQKEYCQVSSISTCFNHIVYYTVGKELDVQKAFEVLTYMIIGLNTRSNPMLEQNPELYI